MPNVPSHSSNSPFGQIQNAKYRTEKLAAEAALADRKAQLDAELEASGKTPWFRRVFRRTPPLPYV